MSALRSVAAVVTLLVLASLSLPSQTQRPTTLDAYVIDVEGGEATHFHTDHIGGAAQLAARLPIRRFVDRGGSTVDEGAPAQALFQSYADARRKGTHVPVRPGDSVATGAVRFRHNTGGPVGGGIVSYEAGGRQFIAVASGRPSRFWVDQFPGAATITIFALDSGR